MRQHILSLAFLFPALVIAHPTESVRTPSWRKLADSVISRIWPAPVSQSSFARNVGQEDGKGSSQAAARYARDIVLRFNLTSVDEALAIKEVADDLYLDIWEFTDNWVDIRLAKDIVPSFLDLLPPSLSKSYAPLIPETVLTSLITSSYSSSTSGSFSPTVRTHTREVFFSDYQPLSVVYPWLRLLASLFSTHARLVTIGQSYEGRDILGIRIGRQLHTDEQPSRRRAVLVTAGTHAREWISTSSLNYLAYTFAISYGKHEIYTEMIDAFDWIFVPVTNPDGYEYTWTTDRLWRKNRQPTPLRFCTGIDLDHSYDFKFDQGTTSNPCSESYSGEEAWEATESVQLRDWALNQTESGTEFVAFLDLHSYSQQVLYPYSYTCEQDPPTIENLEELAFGLVKAMYHSNKHGSEYRPAPACEGNVVVDSQGKAQRYPRLESGGGSALDWFYQEMKIRYSYQIKLRDTGTYGFLLPKDQIIPTGKEVVAAATYLGKFLMGEIGMNNAKSSAQDLVHKFDKEDDTEPPQRHEAEEPFRLEFRRRR